MNMTPNIGISVKAPKKTCSDIHCPFHGTISVRGRQLQGTVTSTKMRRSAVVQWERRRFVKKYERYEKRMTKLIVHAPECLDIKEGDVVRIMESRPISKTKHYIIIDNLGAERGYLLRKEALSASKKDAAKKEVKKESQEENNETD